MAIEPISKITQEENERLRRAEVWNRKREQAIKDTNRHPLNSRARELLGQAKQKISALRLYAHQLMEWRLSHDVWRESRYQYDLKVKMWQMADWTPQKALKYLIQELEEELPLLVVDENDRLVPILKVLNAVQTPEDGADALLLALGEQMMADPKEMWDPHSLPTWGWYGQF